MLEDSASPIPSSIWASMNSWFTPTVLFLLLNLIIGTIALTSTFSKHKQPQNIARSQSVLQSLKSPQQPHPQDSTDKQNPDSDATQQVETQAAHYFFNDTSQQTRETQTHYVYEQSHHETQTHFEDFEEKVVENDDKSMDEVYSELTDSQFSRTKSDTKPTSGEIPTKLPMKMRKSASLKSAFAHFKEDDIVEARRPATVRERGNAKAADEGVDAKADDFINRFKQQLKLQRLDSIIRYKDTIGRGR